jgi:DNA-binding NarL/FixJ family response regulator
VTKVLDEAEKRQRIEQLSDHEFHALVIAACLPSVSRNFFAQTLNSNPSLTWAQFFRCVIDNQLGSVDPKSRDLVLSPFASKYVLEIASVRGEDLRAIHASIAAASESMGDPGTAIHHFLAAGDPSAADRIMAAYQDWALTADRETLRRSSLLPEASGSAEFLLNSAWTSFRAADFPRASAQARLADALLSRPTLEFQDSHDLLSAFLNFHQGRLGIALRFVETILSRDFSSDRRNLVLRAAALRGRIATRLWDKGMVTSSVTLVEEIVQSGMPDLFGVHVLRLSKSTAEFFRGSLTLAEQHAHDSLAAADQLLMEASYEIVDLLLIIASIHRYRFEDEAARDAMKRLDAVGDGKMSVHQRAELLALRAHFAIDSGNLREARTLANQISILGRSNDDFSSPSSSVIFRELEEFLRVRLGDNKGTITLASVQTGPSLLNIFRIRVLAATQPAKALQEVEALRLDSPLERVAASLATAEAQLALGVAPREAVKSAIREAEAERIIRPFLLSSNRLIPVLMEIVSEIESIFAKNLSAALQSHAFLNAESQVSLSRRELAVMRLLATGMSVREAAAHLHISIDTLKAHSTNVARKLGAPDRPSALEILNERGLL